MVQYEGWLEPKAGKSAYRIIDDPKLIAKKNKMREALRNEYTKRQYNPYRIAAGVGGQPFDPAVVRYNSMLRTQTQFFRPGPRFFFASIFALIVPYCSLCYFDYRKRRNRDYKFRTGQVAYKDRTGKTFL